MVGHTAGDRHADALTYLRFRCGLYRDPADLSKIHTVQNVFYRSLNAVLVRTSFPWVHLCPDRLIRNYILDSGGRSDRISYHGLAEVCLGFLSNLRRSSNSCNHHSNLCNHYYYKYHYPQNLQVTSYHNHPLQKVQYNG